MGNSPQTTGWKKGIIATVALMVILGAALISNVSAQDNNLLANPSFEGGYSSYVPSPPIADCPHGVCTTAQMAAGWVPWWVSQTAEDPSWRNRMPEFKRAEAPFLNRVHSGEAAQQYFTFGGSHTAGFFQRVQVPANASLNFSIWGQAWSNGAVWDAPDADHPTSVTPTAVNMRIGIDPTGGTNPFSPSIVWSGVANPYDVWAQLSVQARAQGDWVTVFTYSRQDEMRKHNDIYWDSASLTAAGFVPAPAPSGGGDDGSSGSSGSEAPAAPAAQPQATSTPNADGLIMVAVPPGGSLWSVAARSGISLDEILSYNNMTASDFVQEGDLLVVGYGDPDGESEEVEEEIDPSDSLALAGLQTEEDTAESAAAGGSTDESAEAEASGSSMLAQPPDSAESERAEEPLPTPNVPQVETIAIADTAQGGATICLKAFDDANQNSLHDPGESLRANVAFSISNGQRVVSNYVTTGINEPYCIEGLDAGSYQIVRSQVPGERMTTRGDWGVILAENTMVTVEFGGFMDTASEVAVADTSAQADTTVSDSAEAADGSLAEQPAETSGGGALTIAAVGLAVLLLLGVIVMVMRRPTG